MSWRVGMKSVYLEGALNGFILTHVQGLDELLDLILTPPILSLPPGQLLLVHMAAKHKASQLRNTQSSVIAELHWEVAVPVQMAVAQVQGQQSLCKRCIYCHMTARDVFIQQIQK
jgi:hypothetical protein